MFGLKIRVTLLQDVCHIFSLTQSETAMILKTKNGHVITNNQYDNNIKIKSVININNIYILYYCKHTRRGAISVVYYFIPGTVNVLKKLYLYY